MRTAGVQHTVSDIIQAAPVVRELADALLAGERCAARGVVGSSSWQLAAAISRTTDRPVLVVVAHLDEADDAVDELCAFGVDARRFPALELTPGETQVSLDLFAERTRLARSLTSAPPQVIVAPIHALMQTISPGDEASRSIRVLKRGQTHDPAELTRWLDDVGYRRVDAVEDPGDFATRGGILDVFPPVSGAGEPTPVRLDFFGDELDAIHEIDPETMGSDRALENVELVGAREDLITPGDDGRSLVELLDPRWLGQMNEPLEVTEQARGYYERISDSGGVLGPPETLRRLHAALAGVVELSQYASPTPGLAREFTLPIGSLPPFAPEAREAIRELVELSGDAPTVVFCQNDGEAQRLCELLADEPGGDAIDIRVAYLHRGFLWGDPPELALVPHHELMHRYQTRRRSARLRPGRSMDAFLDLAPGEYAVHADHGLCLFRGLTTTRRRETDDHEEEFLTLEFAKGATLHVPVAQIDKVQRYIGGFRGKPQLSTIGARKWHAQKDKVSEAVRDLAAEMLRIQAARQSQPGVRFPADTTWQKEFEAEFPYDETEDQLAALGEIKKDMQSPRPMDRLLCGDVGYGKTELAIRAAFKAAEYGRQVAVLVPTTILAEQHERTFKERFADYPFRVESLSRFKTAKEQKRVLADLAEGRVDVVIGTHRLLSKDVRFADLGLVVIDEEQRFGVEHKQELMALRMTVDVLTLSATPIPRTLHMALLGIRDISSLATPPLDRRSVVTEVIPFNRERIRRALARELARGGQVYFVHNRVKSIHRIADEARTLAPDARIVVGHGQMPARELENVMLRFVRREADILVCTTIIESGVDIPTANTMVITDADRFGLADLHQLRGRVGRHKHRAYCYLLLPETRTVTEVAKRRLRAIEEFSMLGSGFKIAMRDLEIRGAGNLLGAEQSGHIAVVGYEMYCRLLERAVKQLKNEPADPAPSETMIEIGLSGLLPAGYIPSVRRRIEAYRRIAAASSAEDLERIERDLEDAYGALPKAAGRLLRLAELRICAESLGVRLIKTDGADVVFKCDDPARVQSALSRARGTVRIVSPRAPGASSDIYFRPPNKRLAPETLLTILLARFRESKNDANNESHPPHSRITRC